MTSAIAPFGLRLPPDAKAWVEAQAKRFGSSQNHEIVRAVRERMERVEAAAGNSFQASPAAVQNETAFQGGPITHGL